ncbi:hypothetical protein PTKIN_Ptkin11bG0199200 [Pterospermum kingtungense]
MICIFKFSIFFFHSLLQANQSSFQRTLTVLSRVKSFLIEVGLTAKESLKVMLVCGSDLLQSFSIPGFWIPEQVRTICKDYGVVCIRIEGQDLEKIFSNDEILNENKVNGVSFILSIFFHKKQIKLLICGH